MNFIHWLLPLYKISDLLVTCLNMQEPPTPNNTPQTPKKRAALKRTQDKQWSALTFEQLPSVNLSDRYMVLIQGVQETVESLTRRLDSLEKEWVEVLEHLSAQEDGMEATQSEDELN